ncbi:MAG: FtsW/RodA/SpoVE family cell cycle protein [Clostridiales bacterium]|nr:FtsW/RodA/SpoVE family cell cycle protein [Clostridiales bacterium]
MFWNYKLKNYNFGLLLFVLLLNGLGILILRSASNQDMSVVGKQAMGIILGFAIAIILSLVDYHRVLQAAPVIYLACVGSLAAVLLYGVSRGIARRWITLPVIGQIQPSEFVKIGMIIFFAWFFARQQERLNRLTTLLLAGGCYFVLFFLIFRQPNLSTALITVVIFIGMLFVAGLSYRWILGTLAAVIPCCALFFYLVQFNMAPFLKNYQRERIAAFLEADSSAFAEANLQQNNSIMAIGSGMLQGKGLNTTTLSSVKNGNFLSEEETDFIFAVVGEELGFIGCITVIALIALIVFELLVMAARSKDMAGRLLCAGLATLIAFQSFSNIAVATGIFPNTGLPLPFISSGVSSLLSLYSGIGISMNVGLQRKITNYERI